MLPGSLTSRSMLSFMLFLSFGRVVVLADEEDYDPCKAGKFKSTFLPVLPMSLDCLGLSVNQSIFVSTGNYANSFALVSSPIS